FSPPRPPPTSTLFPYTTLFRSHARALALDRDVATRLRAPGFEGERAARRGDGRGHLPREDVRLRPERRPGGGRRRHLHPRDPVRSEEHTSELQSRFDLVCRLLL